MFPDKQSAKSVVTFGELMLRLDPPSYERFIQADTFKARYTGAEANVAVSLAGFGVDAYAVSKVPAHEIGQACINFLRRYGVNTGFIVRGGDRLGIVYIETGASQRASNVVYDRAHSSIRQVTPGDFDWTRILDGKNAFHFSGTAPALGENVRAVLNDAVQTAKRLGVMVCCDCNYRSRLWGLEEASRVMTGLMEHVNVFLGGVEDAEKLFGIDISPQYTGDERAVLAAQALQNRFGFDWVAMGLRSGDSASANRYAGLVHGQGTHAISKEYELAIVDRVGGGDAFAAGVIFQLLRGANPVETAGFAAAAASLKHSIPGDFNLVSVEEVEQVWRDENTGRIRR